MLKEPGQEDQSGSPSAKELQMADPGGEVNSRAKQGSLCLSSSNCSPMHCTESDSRCALA